MTADPTLNLYTPQALSADQLLSEFIDRKGLLARILDIVRQNTESKPQQHIVIIGPRGMGKTTLLCAIGHSVNRDQTLASQWLPLQFSEEQYNIGDLADFWLECLGRLEHALDRRPDIYDRLLQADAPDLAAQAQEQFFKLLGASGKRALLLVDNLNDTLEAIDKGTNLNQLRSLWMTDPRMMVIGAAPNYFDTITKVDQAFHDFFRTFTLERLNQQELETALRRYAEILGDDTVAKVIEQAPERIAALRILTGGNPRLVKLGYRVLREGMDQDLRRDLERLLDEATPFFKHRIDSLAKETRRVFDAVARRWDPVSVDDVQTELRKPSNYISAQMRRLINEGFIEEVSGDKKKRYQVSERFYNIYYLWRLSREGRRKLQWLVAFMRTFYGRNDYRIWANRLETELRGPLNESERMVKRAHLHALSAADDGYGRAAAFDALVRDAIASNDRQALDEEARDVDPVERHGWRHLLAELCWILDPAARQDLGFRPHDRAWWEKLSQRLTDGIGLTQATARLETLGAWRMDTARHARAAGTVLHWLLLRIPDAESAYRKAIEIDPRYAPGWNCLGLACHDQLRYEEAEAVYRKTIEIYPQYAAAWSNLGNTLRVKARYSEAVEAYRRAIEIDPNYGAYRINLGAAYLMDLDRVEAGNSELLQGLMLDPENARGNWVLEQYWQSALVPAAEKIAANEPGADNLRAILTDMLMERATVGEKSQVRDALLALDEAAQAPFEPLILALKALDDRAILYTIASEKRDLVLDVMARISGDEKAKLSN